MLIINGLSVENGRIMVDTNKYIIFYMTEN